MATPTLNMPRLRLTKQAKVLLAIAGLLLVAAPAAPLLWRAATGPKPAEFIETGMPCSSDFWPEKMRLAMVTTDIGGGSTITRPGMVLAGQPRVVYLCNPGSAQ